MWKSKQQKEPLIPVPSPSILGFYPYSWWEDTSTLKLNREHGVAIYSYIHRLIVLKVTQADVQHWSMHIFSVQSNSVHVLHDGFRILDHSV